MKLDWARPNMPASDIVLILGAIGVLITTVVGAIVTLRRVETVKAEVETTKAEVKVTKAEVKVTKAEVQATKVEVEATRAEIREDVQAVHKIVNQQRTDMLAYQETLIEALQAKGIHVPTDQSLQKE